MAVQPKVSSGRAARTVRKARDGVPRRLCRGRQKKRAEEPSSRGRFQTEYERARVQEIQLLSQIYRLRLGRLSGQLLDRKLLTAELVAAFTSIKEIVLNSKLTGAVKQSLLRNLAEIPIVLVPDPKGATNGELGTDCPACGPQKNGND